MNAPAARRMIAGGLVLAAAVAAAGAGAWLWLGRTAPVVPEQVVIALNAGYAGSCPVLAAQDRGYFAEAGVRAVLSPQPSGRMALKLALEGGADLATVADLPVVFAAMEGRPVAVVANMFKAERDNGIVARRDRGIASPADLKGKRIGVPRGTSPHFILAALLTRSGLAMADVHVVDLAPDAIAQALVDGRVDAVAIWQPLMESLELRLADKAALFYADRVYSAVFVLAGHHDVVRTRKAAMARTLAAVMRGAAVCGNEAQYAAALLRRPEGTPLERVAQLWPSYRFGLWLDQSMLLAFEDQARWAVAEGLARGPKPPNFLQHVDLGPMLVVRPAGVSIIH